MSTFQALGVESSVAQSAEELGFQVPMPIQEQVIPAILGGSEDLICLAQTGTGKTAAYGFPLVQMVSPEDDLTRALVLAPTRELCLQIAGDLKDYANHLPGVRILAIYGGADMGRQIRALKRGAQIVVATPGRLHDLLNRQGVGSLDQAQVVVLDEADEMLNMGFKEELDAILARMPDTRRTLLFSATMPKEVQAISEAYMRDARVIRVGPADAGAEQVSHICYTVRSKDRYLALKRIVDNHPEIYGIIFCRTRQETKEVADKLMADGYNADAIHGDLSQPQRDHVMNRFRVRSLQILVATDVAARGLDVKEISHVIHFNLPDEADVYTHRSGRTGRAGAKGMSMAIVNLKEKFKIRRIETRIRKKFIHQPIPTGAEICQNQLLSLVDRMQTIEVDHKEIGRFLPMVQEKLEFLDRDELIKRFVSLEFNRFFDYYKDSEDLNLPEERMPRKPRESRPTTGNESDFGEAEPGFARFTINLGLKDGFGPRDLIGLINRCTRKRNIEIGRIEVGKALSVFDADARYIGLILSRFKGVEYNRKRLDVRIQDEPSAAGRAKSRRTFDRGKPSPGSARDGKRKKSK